MVKRFIICGNMTIEKIYKLTIKDTAFNLTEEEVSALYETCRRALNISIIGTNPVKPFDNPIAPMYPTWPTPYVTSKGTNSSDNSVMDNNIKINTTWSDVDMSNYSFTGSNLNTNKTSSTNINFIETSEGIKVG